jgi:hypothetical protein
MSSSRPVSVARRKVLAAGAGALTLTLPTPLPTRAQEELATRFIFQRGMSGGGLAQLEGGAEPRLANFGVFASAVQLAEGTLLVLGSIQWIEAGTDLELSSIEVTQCVPMTTRADGAEVRGRMRANGEGDYPFIVRAMDGGRPGSGLDRVEIEVNTPAAREGAASPPSDDAFVYQAAGNLVAGDFQWIIADIDVGA